MKNTIKWSLLIGTGITGIFLIIIKSFQPLNYLHLILFSYVIIMSSVLSSVITHKNLNKRKKPKDRKESYNSSLLFHSGKLGLLHTNNGTYRGRFQNLDDDHVIMDYVVNMNDKKSKVKSLLMLKKKNVEKLEID